MDAETGAGAEYFMINCAHPTHFAAALERDGHGSDGSRPAGERIDESHAELDESTEFDEGDLVDLGARHAAMRDRFPP